MNLRAVLASALLAGATLLWSGAAAAQEAQQAQEADPSTSLSLFPSQLSLVAGRGEVVERTFGVTQTGEPQRELRFEISGDAAPFVTVVDPADKVTPLASIVVTDAAPAYALVRVAPGADARQGASVARIRLVDVRGRVTVGSELLVDVDVKGTYDFAASLLGAEVASAEVEQGRPLRVRLDVDVTGSAPLVPVVSATFRGATGTTHDLVARPASVPGGERSTLDVTWLTTGWDLGRHDAEVVLRSGSTEVGRAPVSVDVVEPGSTQPAVTVLGAELVSGAGPGDVATVVVRARNDGGVEGSVVFAGDLLAGTAPVGPVRSDPVPVAPGETVDLEVLARVGDAGTYRVRGRANLDGAESSLVSVDIEVAPPAGRPWAWYGLGAAALLGGLVLLVAIRRSRRTITTRKPGRPGTSTAKRGGSKGGRPKGGSPKGGSPKGGGRPAGTGTGSSTGGYSGDIKIKVRR